MIPSSSTRRVAWCALALSLAAGCAKERRQQLPDTAFEPAIARPAYAHGEGPVVLIDEGHFNFHTSDNRYRTFADLLRRDGYVVEGRGGSLSAEGLRDARILVIANSLAERNLVEWKLPTPSAFTAEEIAAVGEWVSAGGSLFLIADHMPFPGAAADLAESFGVFFSNGFAYDADDESKIFFRSSEGSLADHPITRGRDASEQVDEVKTFTGQAFRAQGEVSPLLTLPPGSIVRLPVKAWEFSDETPQISGAGLFQGAVLRWHQGRVAVFGEAAMFSAQLSVRGEKRTRIGMNSPDATQNAQFLLNVVHWLSGLLD